MFKPETSITWVMTNRKLPKQKGAPKQAISHLLWQLRTTAHARLLAFPEAESEMFDQRVNWLQAQGVTAIYNYGPKQIDGFQALGLGYGGLVLLVQQGDRQLALKLRRTDGPQASFQGEAEAITTANRCQIGPQLIAHSDDCLLMEYLPGPKFIDWLHAPATRQSATTFKQTSTVIQQLLTQAFRLDQAGLDHGDLRCVTEHVHIETTAQGYRPVVIDFGKASRDRRAANVTTLTQGLFLSTTIARTISERFAGTMLDCQQQPRRSQLIDLLRAYKNNPCKKAHKALLIFLTL